MNKCENKEMSVEHQVSEYLNKQETSIMRKRKFYKYTRRCEAEEKECLYASGKKLMSLNQTCFFCMTDSISLWLEVRVEFEFI